MPQCFVIQRFDNGGPYDKRYRDVLAPAIAEAELEPYRVDRDPTTTIPIDDIEKGIRDSDVCLADITTDNPNIWYEVGFAFAHGKPVVLICAKERPTAAPFDIQHRQIVFYALDSPSDFKKLAREITSRLKGQIKKTEAMQTLASLSPIKTTQGLSSYEIAAMVSIMKDRLTPNDAPLPRDIRQDMRKAGFTDMAASLSLESLKRRELIEFEESREDDFGHTYTVVKLTEKGLDWMMENQERFRVSIHDAPEKKGPELADEDIPF